MADAGATDFDQDLPWTGRRFSHVVYFSRATDADKSDRLHVSSFSALRAPNPATVVASQITGCLKHDSTASRHRGSRIVGRAQRRDGKDHVAPR
jgi:hypothetical protein